MSLLKHQQQIHFIHQHKMTDYTALIETKYTEKTLKRYTLYTVEMNMLVYSEVFVCWISGILAFRILSWTLGRAVLRVLQLKEHCAASIAHQQQQHLCTVSFPV